MTDSSIAATASRGKAARPLFAQRLAGLWLVCVLFTAIFCGDARAADCRVVSSVPAIDFGRLSRATMAPVAHGLALAPRTLRVDIQCADASDIAMAFRADAGRLGAFRMADKGDFTLRLHDATLDEQPVELAYVDTAARPLSASTSDLTWGPGQSIAPARANQILKGRAFSAQVEVRMTFADAALDVRDAEVWIAEGAFEASTDASAGLRLEASVVAGSCGVQLSGDIDFGRIAVSDLARSDISSVFEAHSSPSLRIDCDAPMRFALQATADNRRGTAVGPVGLGVVHPDGTLFGVGQTAAGENIGSYVLLWGGEGLSSDGPVHATLSSDGGHTWSASGSPAGVERTANHRRGERLAYAVAPGSTSGPSELRTLTLPLSARLYVAPSKDLSLGEEAVIQGSVTIEIVY